MKQSFFVVGKLPGANECLWKHWRVFKRLKEQRQMLIRGAIKKQRLQPMKCVSVVFEWHEPDRRRDFDNIMFAQKFVMDSLVQQRILKNDGWTQISNIEHRVVLDPTNPGVRVTLEER